MKATITFAQNDVQTGGMFNKTTSSKYHVTAKVRLTEEEQAIVQQSHIGDAIIYEYDLPLKPGMDPLHIKVDIDKCVSEGIHDAFDTPLNARKFAQKLQDDLLPSLKS
jgi:hypothetical protein